MRTITFLLAGVLFFGNSVFSQKIKIGKNEIGKKEKTEVANASAGSDGKFKVGDVAEGLETDGKWYKVDILKIESGKYFIHWQGFKSTYDRWIEAEKVRAVGSKMPASVSTSASTTVSATTKAKVYGTGVDGFKVGEYAEVLDRDGKWYEAEVQKVNDGQNREYFVKIEGYNGSWVKEANLRAKVAGASSESDGFKVGDKIEAVDFGQWNKGTIQSTRTTNSGNVMFTVAFDNGGTKEFAKDKLRNIPVYNFSGMNLKTGQYVRVWYSGNDSLDAPIMDVKDGKFLINYGGYGAKWFAFDAKEVRNDARAAAIAAGRAMQDQFFQECDKYSDAISAFGYLMNSNLTFYNRGLAPPRPEDVTRYMKDLDELDALIKAKYPNIQNTETLFTTELSKNPGTWREICEKRKELGKKIVLDNLNSRLEMLKKEITGWNVLKAHDLSEFEGGSGISVSEDLQDILDVNGVNFIKKYESKIAVEAKAAEDAGFGQTQELKEFRNFLSQFIPDVKNKFPASLPSVTFNSAVHDVKAEGVVRNHIQKVYSGATIKSMGVIGDFVIVKNNIGYPLNRYKRIGAVILDAKGRCRFLPIYYKEDYAGGGAYGSGYVEHYYDYYQKCN